MRRATDATLAALVLGWVIGPATAAARPQESVWTPVTTLGETLLYLPELSGETADTLVVALHGFGANAADMGRMAPAFTGAGIIYAALQAPYTFDADGRVARDWMLSHRRDPQLADQAARASMQAVAAVVDDLVARYGVDDVYLLGFSQGGRMAYRMIAAGLAAQFAGVVALGAGFDAEAMAGTQPVAGGPRIYIGHGTQDSIPLAGATAARDFLRERGYAVTFESFVGGHEVPPALARAVVAWILGSGPQ